MIGFLLPVAFFVLLFALARRNKEPQEVMAFLIAAYVVRMVLQAFLRDLPVFSYGTGGDCAFYDYMAGHVMRLWSIRGIEFITSEQIYEIANAALPINAFAFIFYLNGGPTRAGCSALVAFCAISSCYQIYRMAVDLGADQRQAGRVMGGLLFLPGFLYYTADMYKDGLVLFFVITALASSFRLTSRFSLLDLLLSVGSLFSLWYVRHYLVFVVVAPLLVGIVGLGKGAISRQIALGGGMFVMITIFLGSSLGSRIIESAQGTLEHASAANVRGWNQLGASGVAFDDGGQAFGAIHLKVIYTLFSPFPWQAGSFAMQMGKIDTMVWYFLFYRAILAGRRLWKEDRTTLFMLLIFLVPLTVAYATSMSNIGLILRQRFPIVFVGSMLGLLSWTAPPRWSFGRQQARAS